MLLDVANAGHSHDRIRFCRGGCRRRHAGHAEQTPGAPSCRAPRCGTGCRRTPHVAGCAGAAVAIVDRDALARRARRARARRSAAHSRRTRRCVPVGSHRREQCGAARSARRGAARRRSLAHVPRLAHAAGDARRVGASGITDDAAAFAEWARRYADALATRHVVDAAQLPDQLARRGTGSDGMARRALRACRDSSSSRRSSSALLAALQANGCTLTFVGLPQPRAGRFARVAASTPQSELAAALSSCANAARRIPPSASRS